MYGYLRGKSVFSAYFILIKCKHSPFGRQVFVEEHLVVFVRPIVFFQVDMSTKHFVADSFPLKANNEVKHAGSSFHLASA